MPLALQACWIKSLEIIASSTSGPLRAMHSSASVLKLTVWLLTRATTGPAGLEIMGSLELSPLGRWAGPGLAVLAAGCAGLLVPLPWPAAATRAATATGRRPTTIQENRQVRVGWLGSRIGSGLPTLVKFCVVPV